MVARDGGQPACYETSAEIKTGIGFCRNALLSEHSDARGISELDAARITALCDTQASAMGSAQSM